METRRINRNRNNWYERPLKENLINIAAEDVKYSLEIMNRQVLAEKDGVKSLDIKVFEVACQKEIEQSIINVQMDWITNGIMSLPEIKSVNRKNLKEEAEKRKAVKDKELQLQNNNGTRALLQKHKVEMKKQNEQTDRSELKQDKHIVRIQKEMLELKDDRHGHLKIYNKLNGIEFCNHWHIVTIHSVRETIERQHIKNLESIALKLKSLEELENSSDLQ